MPEINVSWLVVLVILAILATSFGFLFFAYYRFVSLRLPKFASIRLPVGNPATLEGESLSSISKAGVGIVIRRGSQLFRIRSERDIWVLYVWQGSFGKKHWTQLKRFKSYDKAVSYISEYVYLLEQTQAW
jgi:hypothetical protein